MHIPKKFAQQAFALAALSAARDFWKENNKAYGDDWQERRKHVIDRSDCCAQCGKPFTETRRRVVDHIQPVSKGGPNALKNLRGICQNCDALNTPHLRKQASF